MRQVGRHGRFPSDRIGIIALNASSGGVHKHRDFETTTRPTYALYHGRDSRTHTCAKHAEERLNTFDSSIFWPAHLSLREL